MQLEALGQLVGADRTAQIAEQPEQPPAGRMGERVIGARWKVHRVVFSHVPV
jgi:hypothetical protein